MLLLDYRARAQRPVVNDEDRYEYWRNPAHDRYFFRRLMWASLLSGGHATYGGLRTFEPHDGGPTRGVQGYFDANRAGVLEQGAHDFRHVHRFFREAGLTMAGLRPDDALAGADPRRWKVAHDDATYLVYLANPSGDAPQTDVPAADRAEVTLRLPPATYRTRWYDPSTGQWYDGGDTVSEAGSPSVTLQAPELRGLTSEDWVLLLERDGGSRR